jgi:hypothetical protein
LTGLPKPNAVEPAFGGPSATFFDFRFGVNRYRNAMSALLPFIPQFRHDVAALRSGRPDDKLREAIQPRGQRDCFVAYAPRNDETSPDWVMNVRF